MNNVLNFILKLILTIKKYNKNINTNINPEKYIILFLKTKFSYPILYSKLIGLSLKQPHLNLGSA